ncbi:hypothetical protein ONA91_17740 [Micromonospora sp. DR5-3]|uniref:hypothetical protein n=1 Tax=unclassified Micromonospora TaxID=2617518 RepID=UPI0011DA3E81|nr:MULTISPECIES: hypothetical protein [unclassified Micromonospora]MCW3816290.1 hypothetical protein [Micromonospora sp. DR5-3]TYC23909.1 hypothetical protein FXF52_12755 [Micromonospora sp. MP36]
MPPGRLPAPPVKRKGTKRKVFGIVFAALSIFPLLLGGVVVLQAYKNHQIQVSNDAFAPVAWHNLKADQIFPDYLGWPRGDEETRAWSRQGIAKEASCNEALRKDFAKAVAAKGCKTALRATYVHIGGDVAATIALVVLDSSGEAEAVAEEFSWAKDPGPLVFPVAVPGTLAAKWVKERALAGGASGVGGDLPYVAAISVGPADGTRDIGVLPGEWRLDGEEETQGYSNTSDILLRGFAHELDSTIMGRGQ